MANPTWAATGILVGAIPRAGLGASAAPGLVGCKAREGPHPRGRVGGVDRAGLRPRATAWLGHPWGETWGTDTGGHAGGTLVGPPRDVSPGS